MKKGERKGLMMELELLQEERKNLEWVYKEALSNKGLKSYVFHEKIKALNRVLMEYSEVLGYQIVFSIDLESRSKEFKTRIYRNSQIRDYNDLSGGQQQLVDVGTAFAFHELKEATMDCNILCMDEIFEHLDSENIEIISEFIKMKARKKSVHLITHLEEFNLASTTTLKLKLNKREQTIVVGAL
jgi:DNA repair exonuclease SbcCD ATPase subunit